MLNWLSGRANSLNGKQNQLSSQTGKLLLENICNYLIVFWIIAFRCKRVSLSRLSNVIIFRFGSVRLIGSAFWLINFKQQPNEDCKCPELTSPSVFTNQSKFTRPACVLFWATVVLMKLTTKFVLKASANEVAQKTPE